MNDVYEMNEQCPEMKKKKKMKMMMNRMNNAMNEMWRRREVAESLGVVCVRSGKMNVNAYLCNNKRCDGHNGSSLKTCAVHGKT